MKNIRIFISENFRILVVKFSVYLNRRVFVTTQRNRGNSFLLGYNPFQKVFEVQESK